MYTLGDPGFHLGVLDVERMFLPKLLASAAVVAAMIPVASAQAAAPWSDPVAVPGSTGQAGSPQVLFTRTRGGAIAFNGAGSIPGAPLVRSLWGATGPQQASTWQGAPDFDTGFSAWAAGDRIMYVGPSGRRVKVGIATGPQATWTTTLRGPDTGGARVAAAAVSARRHGRRVRHLRGRRRATSTSSASSASTPRPRPSASPGPRRSASAPSRWP